MQANHRKKINNFEGIFFAFSKTQMDQELKRLNTDKKSICSIGAGGYILKERKRAFLRMLEENKNELEKGFKDKAFTYSAFEYELYNHEYGVTGDIEDTLDSLGITFEELKENKMWLEQMARAEKNVMKNTY